MLKFLSKLLGGAPAPVVRKTPDPEIPDRRLERVCGPCATEFGSPNATSDPVGGPSSAFGHIVDSASRTSPVEPTARPFRRHMDGCKTWTGRRWSPLKIARNHRHETELVFIIDGRLRRVPFEVTPHTSHLPYVVEESFYFVVNRGYLSEEEDLYARTIFPKCPYYRGYIIRENGQYVLLHA